MTAAKSTGASLARHRSKQDVETPPDFMRAVVRRFGAINVDLAATPENKKAPSAIYDHSLESDWTEYEGNLWLNPPFGDIGRWASKCRESTDGRFAFDRVLLLVPASVGSLWFARHVHSHAFVHALVGRVKFVGHEHAFPKDLILCEYGRFRGFDIWDWRDDA